MVLRDGGGSLKNMMPRPACPRIERVLACAVDMLMRGDGLDGTRMRVAGCPRLSRRGRRQEACHVFSSCGPAGLLSEESEFGNRRGIARILQLSPLGGVASHGQDRLADEVG